MFISSCLKKMYCIVVFIIVVIVVVIIVVIIVVIVVVIIVYHMKRLVMILVLVLVVLSLILRFRFVVRPSPSLFVSTNPPSHYVALPLSLCLYQSSLSLCRPPPLSLSLPIPPLIMSPSPSVFISTNPPSLLLCRPPPLTVLSPPLSWSFLCSRHEAAVVLTVGDRSH